MKLAACLAPLAALVAIPCASATARAGELYDLPDRSGPIPDTTLRFELGLGFDAGRFEAGPVGDSAIGGDVRAGLRYDRWLVLARGQLLSLSTTRDEHGPSPDDGLALRAGADVRYSLSESRAIERTKRGRPYQIAREDTWIGAGGGYEWIDWSQGVPDKRPYADIAIGFAAIAVGDDARWHSLATIGLELDLARAPVGLTDPAPSGGLDRSLMLSVGVTFGN